MEETVTIQKAYFDALLRRAQFHSSEEQNWLPDASSLADVTITRKQFDHFTHIAQKYSALHKALLDGGVSQETLDFLVSTNIDDSAVTNIGEKHALESGSNNLGALGTTDASTAGHGPDTTNIRATDLTQFTSSTSEAIATGTSPVKRPTQSMRRFTSFDFLDTPPSSCPPNEQSQFVTGRTRRPSTSNHSMPPYSQRTLLFTNLALGTTHNDVAQVVLGGKLVEIWLRNDRSAQVSFAASASAQNFLNFVKRNDLYINNKRVDVRWSDRQFKLVDHIARKIADGATRNLIIFNGASKGLCGERIRDDMEHIHNLVIIDVQVRNNGDILVSTNSVHNALYARSCMRSRLPYKNLRIQFAQDGCDRPLPFTKRPKYTAPEQYPKKIDTMANMFGVLNTEGTEDGSEDGIGCVLAENVKDSNSFAEYNTGAGLESWADTAIAV